MSPQKLLGDHDPLDLVRALVDLGDLGVAHHALHREVLGVARRRRRAAPRRWSPTSRCRSRTAWPSPTPAAVPGAPASTRGARAVHEEARASTRVAMSASMNCTPWNSATALAELLALVDVLRRGVERALGDADRLGADDRARAVERAHRVRERAVLLADEVRGGDPHFVEQRSRRWANPASPSSTRACRPRSPAGRLPPRTR